MLFAQDNGLIFKLNIENSTAQIIRSKNAKGNIFIPSSIFHNSHKYILTCITSKSFENNVHIKSIEFPPNSELRIIESDAFINSSLEAISIPATVNELQEGWCKGTSKLTKINLSKENPNFKLYNQRFLMSKNEKNEFENIIFANRDVKEAQIPNFIKHIKPFAFYECEQLNKIEFSDDSLLETIEKESFSYSSIEKIKIPSTVKKIGDGCFSWCEKLEIVEFGENSNLLSIGKIAFYQSSLKFISLPSSLERICDSAFVWCHFLKSIQFPDDSELRSIENYAFYGSAIESVSIPSKVEDLKEFWCKNTPQLNKICISKNNKKFFYYENKMLIGKSDLNSDIFDVLFFVNRDVDSVLIPSFIKKIGSFAFAHCQNLKEIEFEENSNLTSIEKGAFASSLIESITIPKHVKVIGEEAFIRCYRLKKIEFAKDSELQIIEKHAFKDSMITSISIPSTVEELQDGWCDGTSKLTNVAISPKNCHFKYLDSDNKIIIGKNKSDKCQDEYENIIFANRDVKEALVPSYIKHIKPFAFYQCSHLKKISFSDDSLLETIDSESFSFSKIESIKIPSTVRIINDSSFNCCCKLNRCEFSPNSELQKIGKDSFWSSFLKTIKIPAGVKTIEEGTFSNCKNIKNIEFEKDSKLKLIDKKAFAYSSIKAISIPPLVKEISEEAFLSCLEFCSIEFLGEHIVIDSCCFKDCTNFYLASFPNAKRVAYVGDFSVDSTNFSLFIRPKGLLISTIE